MPKPRTSKPRRHPRPKVLEVRVMTPRIAWFNFLRILGGLMKLACLLAVAAGLGWGVWLGIQKAIYEDPDFRLQVIDVNPNPVIDANGLARLTGIETDASLFDVNIHHVVASLKTIPAIEHVSAERHLPGTLVVRVQARKPRAWISCAEAGLSGSREVGAMLVDYQGIAYPCPELQLKEALELPVIELTVSEVKTIKPGQAIDHRELAHCFALLKSACATDPEAAHWIDAVKQMNKWSLLLVTRDGTKATFGLSDHDRQISRLRAAMDHASQHGYAIGTINLIPKHNIPITLRGNVPALRATPVAEPTVDEIRAERRLQDLNQILNRN
jgi:hypothetical protein